MVELAYGDRQVSYDRTNGQFISVLSTQDRFWQKVGVTNDCWNWNGTVDKDGYGRFSATGIGLSRSENAARVAYTLARGKIPAGSIIRHSCDNRSCVNPKHLLTGTPRDNVRDMDSRGRRASVSGENNPQARLSWDIICTVRRRYALGEPQYLLAREFGISRSSVCLIVHNKSWVEGGDVDDSTVGLR